MVSNDRAKPGDVIVTNNGGHVIILADKDKRHYYGHTSDRCPGDKTCKNPVTGKMMLNANMA